MIADGEEAGRRRLAARRHDERVKLLAGFLNALAVGAIGAGAIIPATRSPVEFGWSSVARLAIGAVLHLCALFCALWVFALLRPEA